MNVRMITINQSYTLLHLGVERQGKRGGRDARRSTEYCEIRPMRVEMYGTNNQQNCHKGAHP